MIGDVGEAIGGLPRALHENLVGGETERRQLEPHGPLPLVDPARLPQAGERVVDRALAIETVLVEVNVEANTDPVERLADIVKDRLLGGLAKRRQIVASGELGVVRVNERIRDVADVVSLVTAVRKGNLPAEPLEVTCPNRFAEDLHLPAHVVEIVLPRDRVAARLEEPRDRVSDHRVSAMADGERPRRVRRNELHLNFPGLSRRWAFPPGTRGTRRLEPCVPEREREPKVQKTRPADLDPGDIRGLRKVLPKRLRDLAGRAPLGPREHEGEVRRKVTVGRIIGNLDNKKRGLRTGQLSPCSRRLEGGSQKRIDDLLHSPPGGSEVEQ